MIKNNLVWKSKELSHENIKHPDTTDNCLAPSLSYLGFKTRVKLTNV